MTGNTELRTRSRSGVPLAAAAPLGGRSCAAMEPAAGDAAVAPNSSSGSNVASSPPSATTFMGDEKGINEILECPVCNVVSIPMSSVRSQVSDTELDMPRPLQRALRNHLRPQLLRCEFSPPCCILTRHRVLYQQVDGEEALMPRLQP